MIDNALIRAFGVVLITPPPIDAARCLSCQVKKSGTSEIRRESAITAQYAKVVREVGSKYEERVVVIDLYEGIMAKAISESPSHNPDGGILGKLENGECKALIDLLPDGLWTHFKKIFGV
jgi:hypothetical protein